MSEIVELPQWTKGDEFFYLFQDMGFTPDLLVVAEFNGKIQKNYPQTLDIIKEIKDHYYRSTCAHYYIRMCDMGIKRAENVFKYLGYLK